MLDLTHKQFEVLDNSLIVRYKNQSDNYNRDYYDWYSHGEEVGVFIRRNNRIVQKFKTELCNTQNG